MARLTRSEAVALLAASPLVTATDEHGVDFSFQPTSATGTQLVVRTERLRLASVSQATVRLHDAIGRPWLLDLRIESAELHRQYQAEAVLRAVGLRLDPAHRAAERIAIDGKAALTAINCKNVVDGDLVEARILDVAEGGVAVVTQRLLRPGDRLFIRARFFATEFDAEVRVARVSERNGMVEVGCRFISMTGDQRRTLRDV